MKKLLAMAALAAAMTGCRTETAGTSVFIDTESGEAAVVERATRVATKAEVTKVTYAEADGIRSATVTIRSKVQRRIEMQARMVWMDEEGTEIDSDGKPFRQIILDGRDSMTFKGMAPNARGVRAKLQLREADMAQ